MDLLLFTEMCPLLQAEKWYTNQNNFCCKEPVNQANPGKTVKGPRGIATPIVQGSQGIRVIPISQCPVKCSGRQRCQNLLYVILRSYAE